MSHFDGHIHDLGELPHERIVSVSQKLEASTHLWAGTRVKFSTEWPSAEHIVLKFPDNYPHRHAPASYRPGWPEWEPLLAPIIAAAAGRLGLGAFDTSKVMFTRLNPGGKIGTHIDENPSSVVPHKIHVPVLTHPNVTFHIGGVPYHLQVGRAYEVNNLLPHSVENDSETPRVHFIFDCYPLDRESRG